MKTKQTTHIDPKADLIAINADLTAKVAALQAKLAEEKSTRIIAIYKGDYVSANGTAMLNIVMLKHRGTVFATTYWKRSNGSKFVSTGPQQTIKVGEGQTMNVANMQGELFDHLTRYTKAAVILFNETGTIENYNQEKLDTIASYQE